MKMRKIFVTFAMVFVLAAATKIQISSISSIEPQDPVRGPAVSSPAVEIAPNGDRVGHYPPYFYPDH